MSKLSVSELANEFTVSAEEVVTLLRQMDIPIRSHMSMLTDDQVARIRARWEREKRVRAEKQAAPAPTARRRRAVAVPEPVPEPAPVAGDGPVRTCKQQPRSKPRQPRVRRKPRRNWPRSKRRLQPKPRDSRQSASRRSGRKRPRRRKLKLRRTKPPLPMRLKRTLRDPRSRMSRARCL